MANCISSSYSIKQPFIPVIVGILFCQFRVLLEEPEVIPDTNRLFFNGSLNKVFYINKKDGNLDKVLKAIGPPAYFAHIMNVMLGHYLDTEVILKENNGEYTLVRRFPIGEKAITFRIGVEFEEISFAEDTMRSVVIQDRDTLIHIQRQPYNRPTVVTTRWFTPDRLVVVMEIPRKNLTTRLVYRPAECEDSRYQEVPRRP